MAETTGKEAGTTGLPYREECHGSTHIGRPDIGRNTLPIGRNGLRAATRQQFNAIARGSSRGPFDGAAALDRARAADGSGCRRAGSSFRSCCRAGSSSRSCCPAGTAARITAVRSPARKRRCQQARAGARAANRGGRRQIAARQAQSAEGFKLEVYASGIADARTLAQNDNGSVIFVGNRVRDKVYAIVNKDGKRDVKIVAQGLYRRTASRSRTARSTSPSCRRFQRSTMCWPISTRDRRSRPSSIPICRRTKPMAGSIWRSVRQQALFRGRPARQQCLA